MTIAHSTREHSSGPDLRVVLVGRTGVEAALRRDAGVELIRTAAPTDAICEVIDPIDGESPHRTTVIVGPDAIDELEACGFVAALRSVSPDVRVLTISPAVNGQAGGPISAGPFDGRLAMGSDGASLRSVLDAIDATPRAEAHAPTQESHASTHQDEPTPTGWSVPEADAGATAFSPSAPAPDALGAECAALDAMLAGDNPLPHCLHMLRKRSGDDELAYIPFDRPRAACDEQDPRQAARATIHRGGRTFGWLESCALEEAALENLARVMAGWLTLADQQSRLRDAAFKDHLTGAWNRRYFDKALPLILERARNRRNDIALMVFDIDDFKIYNDRFGHSAGDEILLETVRMLQSVIRPSDRVCRIGGDEFAVIFNDPDGPRVPSTRKHLSVSDIARRFQRQICDHRFPKLGAQAPGALTISGGLATYPWDASDSEGLLERADQLALESKRQGKNLITFGPGAERLCESPQLDERGRPPRDEA
ncbi:MAG: GGDEF domain-containing protein [Phycisphaeraceae bacterium]|nr:MAG: GGDEF domain-containing protein [Phycisphaeraceae bacterium]